jgi:hypothetical protein
MPRLPISRKRPFAANTRILCPSKLIGQRVEHQVHALAAGQGQNLVGEGQRARIHDVGNAQVAQESALFRAARRGKNGGPGPLRQVDGGQAHTTRSGVNEHFVARLHLAEMFQGESGRQVRNRHGGGGGRTEVGAACAPPC